MRNRVSILIRENIDIVKNTCRFLVIAKIKDLIPVLSIDLAVLVLG